MFFFVFFLIAEYTPAEFTAYDVDVHAWVIFTT